MGENYNQVLYIHLPVIEDWMFYGMFSYCKFTHRCREGLFKVDLVDTTAKMAVELDRTPDGLLKPVLLSLNADFAKTSLELTGNNWL
jgi:hypothetical protein